MDIVFLKSASFYGATRSRVRTITVRGLENELELRGSPKLKVFWFQCIFIKKMYKAYQCVGILCNEIDH
jgi:hypothetical protein